MRFDSITIHNLGPFADVHLDLSRAEGKLIAITGANGAGKSTLLELLAASLYRDCPTRGSLLELATARDARLEVRAVNGSPFTISQLADPVSKRSETLILRNGEPVLEGTSVRAADTWIASHLPPPEVMFASQFLPQCSEGFVKLSPSQRKTVLLRLLQIERYEVMADKARENVRSAKAALATAQARYADACSQIPDLAASEAAATEARAQVAAADTNLLGCRDKLARAERALAEHLAASQSGARRTLLVDKLGTLRLEEADIRERIANNETLLAKRDAILADVERLRVLTQAHETKGEAVKAAAVAAGQARTLELGAARASVIADKAWKDACRRLKRFDADLADQAQVEDAVNRLAELREAHLARSGEARDAAAAYDKAVKAASGAQDKRIRVLRTGLKTIADGASPTPATDIADATLQKDTRLRAAADPKRLERLELADREASARFDSCTEALRAAEQLAARAQDLRAAAARVNDARKEQYAAYAQAETAAAELATAQAEAEQARTVHEHALAALELVQAHMQAAEENAALMPKLEYAETRLQELRSRLTTVNASLLEAQEELAALPPPPAKRTEEVQAYRDACERGAQRAEAARLEATAAVALAERSVDDAKRGADTRSNRARDVKHWEQQLSDWQRLAQDLGKDGLQALEIDAAIPQLNTLINDLLHTCHGSRFSVELRTTRLSSDGKSMEGMDIRVLDTVNGRDALIESYSGGERVLIGEAVSLALTMLACQHAGLTCPTLVRDESGASLDPGNGRAYIAMLRRAADFLQADKVLFVTHSAELQELADATIRVADGQATLNA